MAQRPLQIAPDPRQVLKILRLAVAQIEAGGYAQKFSCTLCGKRRVHPDECGRIEIRLLLPAAAHVAAEQRKLRLLGNIYPRVLEERSEIVGSRTHHGILEIQNAQPGNVAAARQPQEIRRMEI